jgi:hypothetical protein
MQSRKRSAESKMPIVERIEQMDEIKIKELQLETKVHS